MAAPEAEVPVFTEGAAMRAARSSSSSNVAPVDAFGTLAAFAARHLEC